MKIFKGNLEDKERPIFYDQNMKKGRWEHRKVVCIMNTNTEQLTRTPCVCVCVCVFVNVYILSHTPHTSALYFFISSQSCFLLSMNFSFSFLPNSWSTFILLSSTNSFTFLFHALYLFLLLSLLSSVVFLCNNMYLLFPSQNLKLRQHCWHFPNCSMSHPAPSWFMMR